jgi:hypothetical protein
MFRLRYLLAALLVPATVSTALAAGSAGTAPALAPSPMGCEIRVSDTALGREVVPVAWSSLPLAASYEFTVSKVSRSGTAISSQSGDFETLPGVPMELSTNVFDRKGSLAADLTVRWSGGVVACDYRAPRA